jgi:hypothetical protein
VDAYLAVASKRDQRGYPARAGPGSPPTRGVDPPRRCARPPRCSSSLGHQVQEIAIEVEEGCDNFIKVWIAQTGDEVHTYERLWARSIGCAATRGG